MINVGHLIDVVNNRADMIDIGSACLTLERFYDTVFVGFQQKL
jgi:hypothetical protein